MKIGEEIKPIEHDEEGKCLSFVVVTKHERVLFSREANKFWSVRHLDNCLLPSLCFCVESDQESLIKISLMGLKNIYEEMDKAQTVLSDQMMSLKEAVNVLNNKVYGV